jgi:hypothetical protein
VLLFHGLEFREDGRFYKVKTAQTLTEAEVRASKLQEKIAGRKLHNHLLLFCKADMQLIYLHWHLMY